MNKFPRGGALILFLCGGCGSLLEPAAAQSLTGFNQTVAVPQPSGQVQFGGIQTNQLQPRPRPRGRLGQENQPPTLGLEQGFIELETPDFNLKLVKASQTVAALQPKGAGGFDFTPADQLQKRAGDHYFHLGDVTFRVRAGAGGAGFGFSTAAARQPIITLPVSGDTLAAADLTPTLPANCPLQIIRSWLLENGKLVLKFDIKNKSDQPVEIGSFGIPLVFNNFITGRSLADAHEICSFSDPAICEDAGYVQVTRLNGRGPALVVVPAGKTPLEAYNPISNPRDSLSAATEIFSDRTPRSQTFEGFYEWMPLSRAYAENEWTNAQPWNPPTSVTLASGATRTFGLKFLVAPEIRDIEKTLAENNRPVAVGIPGYILAMDLNARLFLKYSARVKSVKVEPEGALTWSAGILPASSRAKTRRQDAGAPSRLANLHVAREKMGPRAADDYLRGWLGANHQLRCHQAGSAGRRRSWKFFVHEAMVHRRKRSVPPRAVGDDLRPHAQSHRDTGCPRVDRRAGRRRRRRFVDRGGDERIRPAEKRRSRKISAVRGRCFVGRHSIHQRPVEIWRAQKSFLLRHQRVSKLLRPEHPLRRLDELEQA